MRRGDQARVGGKLGRETSRARWTMALPLLAALVAGGCVSASVRTAFEPQWVWTEELSPRVERFVVVLDASGSMNEPWRRERKVTLATRLTRSLNGSLPELGYSASLRAVGRETCLGGDPSGPLFGPAPYDRAAFEVGLDRLRCAGGASRVDRALAGAGDDLDGLAERAVVVLVSDGVDLGGNAVAAARALKERHGDGLCIWGVLVGSSLNGARSLERVVEAGECGGLVSALELRHREGMATFVRRVFVGPDGDGDGVVDDHDRCPGTEVAVPVDLYGCPRDSDGDGVRDHLDRCPDTPAGVRVDASGCPVDSDRDGVPDYLDRCPRTPRGASVDEHGCPLDSDADGVFDHLDRCPDTPAGVPVDQRGCPLDSDGDGVPDHLDSCPDTPTGVPVDEHGCPLADVTVRGETWSVAGDVLFDLDRAEVKPQARVVLDQLAAFLVRNPNYLVVVEGHTDGTGSLAHNLELSQLRADAVRGYLVRAGVADARLSTNAVGPANPVAANDTPENRARNRRVEFRPSQRATAARRAPDMD